MCRLKIIIRCKGRTQKESRGQMKALRLHLHQNSANYRKEETINNKMTYPLPPYSTVIGALHDACGFKEYKAMDISIQGNFQSLQKRAYTDHCFLNTTQDDRGNLVKLYNPDCLSKGYILVGSAIKSQGNSFRKDITVKTVNQECMQEYRELKDLKDKIDIYKKNEYADKLQEFKEKKKSLAQQKKEADSKSDAYQIILEEEKRVKLEEKEYKERVRKYEEENYKIPISYFRTLTTSLKFYELLDDIELYIHVKSDEETLKKILENIYRLKSLGRSEDFVEVLDADIVELKESVDKEIKSKFAGYVSEKAVKGKDIFTRDRNIRYGGGTKYFINKNYEYSEDGKQRVFHKKKVYYLSGYSVDEESENLYFDTIDENTTLIVNFE